MASKCPKCHADNPDTSRFCGDCGTQMKSAMHDQPAVTKTLESPTRFVARGTVFAARYELLDSIGAGGMGEVYRALDRNLGRDVAIKILPAAFAEDKERMARLEREAKLLATLSHPNIAAIHSFEKSEGRRFLVLELAEGETLQSRLNKGALSVEESLDVCRQLAEGLEAAHEKGIVHRDLKPGNIMLTTEGRVKILDFGLAKASAGESAGVDIANSPTITAQMTEPGVILGTAAYMSPEQARGRQVDKRTDIWSFGCVLYECLTGSRAFNGETVSDYLAHILKGEPNWNRLPPDTPLRIKSLLRRCLEKNSNERLRDVGDARIEISGVFGEPAADEGATPRNPYHLWKLTTLIGAPVLAVMAALIGWHLRPTVPHKPVVRTILKIGPDQWLEGRRSTFERPSRTAMALAGDGSFIVYSAISKNPGPQGRSKIYMRRLDQIEATLVAGTEGGINPFLSPDDQWIGFWDNGKLMKVPADGGISTILCDTGEPFGVDWGPDNKIVFSSGITDGLSWISGEGEEPESLTVPDAGKGEVSHRLPHFLPDGTGVLFTIMGEDGYDLHPQLALLDLERRKWRIVMEDAADGRYVRTGHLLFLRQGVLMAAAFDIDRLQVKGEPLAVVGDVMQALNLGNNSSDTAGGQYSVSAAGGLVYVPGGICPDRQNSLERLDLKGNGVPVADYKAPFAAPRFSPDGKWIAYRTIGKEWRLWIYDLDRDTHSPVTRDGRAGYASWTPDGKRLAFDWFESGPRNIYWQSPDSGTPMEPLTSGKDTQRMGSFAQNGATMVFMEAKLGAGWDILLFDMKSREATSILNSTAREVFPEISPDGHWLAYVSDESGQSEVWVRSLAGQVVKRQLSTEGGSEPLWSKDGKRLFYRQGDKAFVVDLETEPRFSVSKPRLLFTKPGYALESVNRNWDLWPDGQGFLMVKTDERQPQAVSEIVLVQNWFEELKRLVPVSNK